jgi:polyvinyl alcohol dehydrogenase (cytochrome)
MLGSALTLSLLSLCLHLHFGTASAIDFVSGWSSQGRDLRNSRNADGGFLALRSFDLYASPATLSPNDTTVSATPGVSGNRVVFSTWDGKLRSYNKRTGSYEWEKDIAVDYYNATSGGAPLTAKTTAAFWGDDKFVLGLDGPSDVLVVDLLTGRLIRKLTLDAHPHSLIAQSGTVYGDLYYVGTSSREEAVAASNASYPCCSFGGAFYAVNLTSGTVAWSYPTVPLDSLGPGAWSGGGVIGSSPAVDEATRTVYATTGLWYRSPSNVSACVDSDASNDTSPAEKREACVSALYPRAWFQSVLAFDLDTGDLKVGRRFGSATGWLEACSPDASGLKKGRGGRENCPSAPPELEAGFSASPNLGHVYFCDCGPSPTRYLGRNDENGASDAAYVGLCRGASSSSYEKHVCGRKSPGYKKTPVLYVSGGDGVSWCLNATDLSTVWATRAGPFEGNGPLVPAGSALDARRYYGSVSNANQNSWTLVNGTSVHGGGWFALDRLTGAVLWTSANPANYDPSGEAGRPSSNGRSTTAWSTGAPASFLGGLLVGSMDAVRTPNLGSYNVAITDERGFQKLANVGSNPTMSGKGGYAYVLNKIDGSISASYESGTVLYGGFSLDERCAWVGSGYSTDLPREISSPGGGVLGWCVSPRSPWYGD